MCSDRGRRRHRCGVVASFAMSFRFRRGSCVVFGVLLCIAAHVRPARGNGSLVFMYFCPVLARFVFRLYDCVCWVVTVSSRRGLLLRCSLVFACCQSHRQRCAVRARRRERAAWRVLVVCRVLSVIRAFYLLYVFHVCL